ncbi:MAG TPA: FAD-binding oxidoreductase [Dehalococcoidia bacterium]|nr:FAD-binding oxidoreductase [Dehalococcoidia bacterium]
MVRQASLQTELEPIVGPENLRPAGAYVVDGVMPRVAVAPRDAETVAAVVRYANERGLTIIPQGGRRHIALGNVPTRYDIAVDTTGLADVVEYEPEDLTITVQAGMTLGALRKATAKAAQAVPFDPSLPDEATVGGALAADAWGAARMSLGAARDFTIGLRVVTGDGLVTRAGGRVVKNVAGYDMCKLYIGSLGTLAVITEATFKTLPLPKAMERLAFGFAGAEEACRVPNEAIMRGLTVRSAVVSREGSRWLLDVQLAGSPAAVKHSVAELRSLAREEGGTDAPPPAKSQTRAVTSRVLALPSRVAGVIAALPKDATIAAYPTLGVARVGSDAPLELGVPSVIEACPAAMKAGREVFGDAPASLELMRAMKAKLDPKGVLGPGRFVGGI